ncbi:MAG: hypothetical protein A3J63_00465 [Candidatus Moranbacteria bacterium RIFCSPHIGHO2_02_FULL_40_12b]|nr:MAG: hypothetical protein A3J63_00465 [Candidatus Moranbacteria bacterium RIFCSPHIGHO2_02_FULL_40_12b]OGI23009.1 MAG: hypothetical protein A3E91_03310 [Candidatus Moranbacteria bacterium RIFCSPHIGHO2_12_FULL_40_10]
MKLVIKNIKENSVNMLRKVGYVFQRHEGSEMSFVRVLARSGFPRFHVFVKMKENNLLINIHLDQKKETYGKAKRHHGEYSDSQLLNEEIERIREIIQG